MRRSRRFIQAFARWEKVLALAAVALPLVALCVLGFVWLAQQGLFLHFLALSVALGGTLALVRHGTRWVARRRTAGAPAEAKDVPEGVAPDPEWNATEAAAFAAASDLIRARTRQPLPWPELQATALDVVTLVAERSGGKSHLSFTVPEALLLIEQVTARFRADLRAMVPLSDTISISTLHWMWQYRAAASQIMSYGQFAWRVVRAVKNAPAAILQEIERATTSGHASLVTNEAMAIFQSILLEELAKAAVDLYSGRLRFSDAELLEIQIAGSDLDRARLAHPDAPLRIVVAGQVSAGKSALINALVQVDRAETDAAPTTLQSTGYEMELGGVDCVLVDLPGLDGGTRTSEEVLAELRQADIILWAIRANRPAREIDRRLIAAFDDGYLSEPARRRPALVTVATCIDTLLDGWPFPENHLPPPAVERIAAAVTAIGEDIGRPPPIPVCAQDPQWNVDTLRQVLVGTLGEGLMVQRNRSKLAAKPAGYAAEAARAAFGTSLGIRTFGARFLQRRVPGR